MTIILELSIVNAIISYVILILGGSPMLKKYEKAKNLMNGGRLVKNAVHGGKWISDTEYHYKKYPIGENEYKHFEINALTGEIKDADELPEHKDCSYSPDGKYQVILKEHNLYLKNLKTEELKQFTFDGKENYSYGDICGTSEPIKKWFNKTETCAGVLWNKESDKLITYAIDDAAVKDLFVVQNAPRDKENPRPILHKMKYSLPGDEEIIKAKLFIYDLKKDKLIPINYPELPVNFAPPISDGCMKIAWTKNRKEIYFTALNRYFNEAKLVLADPETGKTRVLLTETTDTFLFYDSYGESDGGIDYNFTNYVFSDKPYFIWQSQKSGFNHLYLYDKESGKKLKQLTNGEFEAISLVKVDEDTGDIFFTARGFDIFSDPYYQTLCKININGGELEILAKEDAFHRTALSPDGKRFVDIVSRIDMPPVAKIVEISSGKETIFETADITELLKAGYVVPKRFSYLNEDGIRLYGIIVLPPDIGEKAPLIDYIYGGVQCNNVPKEFTWEAPKECMGSLQSYAQFGIIGIIVDGVGTPNRGKAFHDVCYKNLGGAAGLKDHVYVLDKLAADYPQIDLNKVGIWGVSGGGYATFRAMCLYPDTYKVGVSFSGNHNERTYCTAWVERYNGEYNEKMYDEQQNSLLAKNLKGKLFIAHGDIDDNVNVSATMGVVDALIQNNKDFDMMIVPNTFHDMWKSDYMIRRKWDYFVKNLLGIEPPKEFEM